MDIALRQKSKGAPNVIGEKIWHTRVYRRHGAGSPGLLLRRVPPPAACRPRQVRVLPSGRSPGLVPESKPAGDRRHNVDEFSADTALHYRAGFAGDPHHRPGENAGSVLLETDGAAEA